MIPTLKYFWQTCRHKWFVLCAGMLTGAKLWDLIKHDWTKFLPSELPHYGRQFFGKADDPEGFLRCWIHHQNHNPHHWEYWIPRTGHTRCTPPMPGGVPFPMPERYVREMLADWLGAGRAYEGKWPDLNDWTWLKNNRSRIQCHPDTWLLIDYVIVEMKVEAGLA